MPTNLNARARGTGRRCIVAVSKALPADARRCADVADGQRLEQCDEGYDGGFLSKSAVVHSTHSIESTPLRFLPPCLPLAFHSLTQNPLPRPGLIDCTRTRAGSHGPVVEQSRIKRNQIDAITAGDQPGENEKEQRKRRPRSKLQLGPKSRRRHPEFPR